MLQTELKDLIEREYGCDISKAAENVYPGSMVYTFEKEAKIVFVRCNSMKARKTVLSEMLWMDNLNLHTDAVCVPIPSADNHLTELLELDGIRYTISMFNGIFVPIKANQTVTAKQIRQVGELLGKIHAASKIAAAEGFHYQRKKWNEILLWGKDFIIREQGDVEWRHVKDVLSDIEQYPETPETFGLIHGDFHWQNFYQKEDTLGVFDFDSCQYSFYMHDIASVYRVCEKQGWEKKESFLEVFRKGYELHMSLSEVEWRKLDHFQALDKCFELLSRSTGK